MALSLSLSLNSLVSFPADGEGVERDQDGSDYLRPGRSPETRKFSDDMPVAALHSTWLRQRFLAVPHMMHIIFSADVSSKGMVASW